MTGSPPCTQCGDGSTNMGDSNMACTCDPDSPTGETQWVSGGAIFERDGAGGAGGRPAGYAHAVSLALSSALLAALGFCSPPGGR